MNLRRATAEDAPACAAIVRSWLDASDWMPAGPSLAELTQMMRDGFPKREAYVAERGEQVLGYLSLDAAHDHIHGLYVETPGQGVGRALLDRAKQGRGKLSLNTHRPNKAAHRFYQREGFTIVARDLPGEDGVSELRMQWHR